ncbi:hypothetical protein [Paraburkholderia diazotrophica]|uniref:Uncharacterized protein n=1 Tax=Paraburkholderia diazotrophica TaxID=667676 RepID=A0A1H6ZZ95_9BURK|nr:hypothetical protein [Paraburkholderia diazotrophica]SEJ56977.1 hypothetical protein SAMN05192539_101374 [Paraburkholderia diazotrophica]
MSALTVIFCVWTLVALCAVFFIRGASARIEQPVGVKPAQPSRYSIAE